MNLTESASGDQFFVDKLGVPSSGVNVFVHNTARKPILNGWRSLSSPGKGTRDRLGKDVCGDWHDSAAGNRS